MTGRPLLPVMRMLKIVGMPIQMMKQRQSPPKAFLQDPSARTRGQSQDPNLKKNLLKMKSRPPLKQLKLNARRRPRNGERRRIRPLWLPGQRTTYGLLSAVFWDTLIRGRPNCWTKSDRRMCKKAKLVVSHNRLVLHTSLLMLSSRRLPLSTVMESSSSRFPVY